MGKQVEGGEGGEGRLTLLIILHADAKEKEAMISTGMEGRQREESGELNCSLSLLTYMSWEDKDHFRGRRGSSFKLIGQAAGQGTRTSQSQTDTEEEGVCISVCLHVCVCVCTEMCLH